MKAGELQLVQNYKLVKKSVKKSNLGDLDISYFKLTSMEGCPEKIFGYFGCSDNFLTSFEHFPKLIIGNCYISNNSFTSFKDIDKYIKHICGYLCANDMDITSGFSDLFGIDGLQSVAVSSSLGSFFKLQPKLNRVVEITNKYLYKKDLIEFQDEMIKTGYESFL